MRDYSTDFWKLLVGQTVSSLGSSFTLFALPLLIFKLTNSAIALALMTVAEYIPFLLFGLAIGVWVDRIDRKRMMIFADVTQAVILCSVPLLSVLGLLSVWWIYAVGFISSTLWICFNTAEFASVPSLVRKTDLVRANGRLQASYSAATVTGPLLAGLLVALVPVHTLLLFDAFSFLLSALAVSLIGGRLDAVSEKNPRSKGLFDEVAEGLSFILGHPVLRATCFLMALVNGVGFTVYAQLVLYAKERLGASDTQVGLLYAAGSIGMVVLALAAGPLRRHLSFSKAVLSAPMLGGIFIVLLASTRWYWTALVLWASIWGLVVFFDINTNSLLQTVVPEQLLGRVRSAVSVLSWSAIPLGTIVGGVAIERTQDVALVYGAIGAIVSVAALVFTFTAVGHANRYLPPGKR
ncbi:MAG TPA: MFS transporter [Rubrobacter sp.]|nr:MFS transporter [Rubrobacter sp.]